MTLFDNPEPDDGAYFVRLENGRFTEAWHAYGKWWPGPGDVYMNELDGVASWTEWRSSKNGCARRLTHPDIPTLPLSGVGAVAGRSLTRSPGRCD